MFYNSPIKKEIYSRLASGESKQSVFDSMVSQGNKPPKVAHYIASFSDPALAEANSKWIDISIVVNWVSLVFTCIAITFLGLFGQGSPSIPFILTMTMVLIGFGGLFHWGMSRPILGFYTALVFYSYFNVVLALPTVLLSSAGVFPLLVNLGFLFLYSKARSKIFPDIRFFGPRKKDGQYVFAS